MTARAGSAVAVALATACLVAAAAGCSDPDLEPTSLPTGTSSPDEGPDLRAPIPSPDPPADDGGSRGPCAPPADAAIDEAIGGQLAAFAADDYVGALGFASEEFRAGIDVDAFEDLIEDAYPLAADATDHDVQQCVRLGASRAEALVTVTGSDGASGQLLYLLVDEGDAWRIAGAIEVDEADDDATVV